jgi:GlpG protein
MRLIGELDDGNKARTFAAYLLVKGIETQVDEENGKSEIWAKDEDRFQESLEEFNSFKLSPNDAKYTSAMSKAKAIVKEEEKKRLKIQKNIVNVSGGNLPKQRRLTVILIAICGIVGLLTNFGERSNKGEAYDNTLFRSLQFLCIEAPESAVLLEKADFKTDDLRVRFASLMKGEVWRSFTQMFIHLGVFHILFNLIWLFQFGTVIEHRYGWLKFGLLVLGIAIISSLFQCGVPDALGGSSPFLTPDKTLMTGGGGMSGVVYGLFGFIWMKSIYDRKFGYRLQQSTVILLIGWLFFCMLPVEMRKTIGFGVSIGNWAHGIGLLVGMGVGYFTSVVKLGQKH